MIETLKHFDQEIILFINHLHSGWLDPIMWSISKIVIFTPLFIVWLFYTFRLLAWKKFILFIVATLLLITLTDQTSTRTKYAVERYRPTHNLEIGTQIHTINNYRGGTYGFYSGHAANTFGIAFFLFLLFRKRRTWIKYSFFPFAILASYSRMYLGVHYPSDILVGMLSGIFYGWLIYRLFLFVGKTYFDEVRV